MFKFAKSLAMAVVVAGAVFGVMPAAYAVEAPTNSPVLDNADLFTPEQEAELAQTFAAAPEQYGLVFVIETVTTLDGQAIADVALAHANEFAVGDAEKDNGVFILLSRDDREIRFELGAGVSPVVSDSTVNAITEADVLPHFRDGDYFTGVVNGTASIGNAFVNPPAPAEAGTPFDWGNFWKWAAIIVGGVVGLIVLVIGTLMGIDRYNIRQDNKARELSYNRHRTIKNLVGDMWYDGLLQPRLLSAANDAERKDVLAGFFAKANMADKFFESTDDMYEPFLAEYLSAKFNDIQDDYRGVFSKLKIPKYGDMSIEKMLTAFRELCEQEAATVKRIREQQRAEEKARRERQAKADKIRREQQAKADKERKELERLQKEASEIFWSSLTSKQKSEIKAAKTKKQKVATLSTYNTTPMQPDVMFPILLAMYASEVGKPEVETRYGSYASDSGSSSSGSGSSSRSSSSSSSSSYSSPSYDSGSSYSGGGGSFDGGGGGGSW